MRVSLYRIFFDTSAYIAGLVSTSGAARELLRLAETQIIGMVVSEEVITEVDRVLSTKFPGRVLESRQIWKNIEPEIAPNPTTNQTTPFLKILEKGDAEILCAASLAKVSAFVTWNTRDFMKHEVSDLVNFPVVVPAQGLKLFREWMEPFR